MAYTVTHFIENKLVLQLMYVVNKGGCCRFQIGVIKCVTKYGNRTAKRHSRGVCKVQGSCEVLQKNMDSVISLMVVKVKYCFEEGKFR